MSVSLFVLEFFVFVQGLLVCLFVRIVRACPRSILFVSRFACLGDMCDCLFINLIVYLFVRIVCACPESILLGCFVFYLFVRIVPACPGITCLFVQIVRACPGREHWHSKLRFAGRGNKLDSAPASCQISSESRDLNFDLFTQDALKENIDVFQKYNIDC